MVNGGLNKYRSRLMSKSNWISTDEYLRDIGFFKMSEPDRKDYDFCCHACWLKGNYIYFNKDDAREVQEEPGEWLAACPVCWSTDLM